MNDSVLIVGKFVFLAFLYLFFARVMRAMSVELRGYQALANGAPSSTKQTSSKPPKPERKTSPSVKIDRGSPTRVVVTSNGKSQTVDLSRLAAQSEITIGRGSGCGIPLDDSFASQVHARIFESGGKPMLEDLGSTNGTVLNDDQLGAPRILQVGDRVTIGSTTLEFSK